MNINNEEDSSRLAAGGPSKLSDENDSWMAIHTLNLFLERNKTVVTYRMFLFFFP